MKVIFSSQFETIQDYLTDKSKEEVKQIKKKIRPCVCESKKLILTEYENMGDISYKIECKNCKKTLSRGQYDFDVKYFEDILNFLIRDWNNGLTQNDLDKAELNEYNRKTLKFEDLKWKKLYPNNIIGNGIEGIYSLIFKQEGKKIYCCKWTIKFQKEEISPMSIKNDSKIEAYNLFMKRYFDVQGILYYPKPSEYFLELETDKNTLNRNDVNSYGNFIRSYKTLGEAKLGAVARCGWQGLNKDTVLVVKENI